MTAIAIGKLPFGNLIVSDSIVQLSVSDVGHEKARVEDKIYDVQSSNQYVTLLGEGLLLQALSVFDTWLAKNNKTLDLFDEKHFNQFLLAADKHREIVGIKDPNPLPIQETSTLYVVSKEDIKEYKIELLNKKYVINSQSFLNCDELIINYKGNKKTIDSFVTNIDKAFEDAKSEIYKEHEYRKNEGFMIGKKPLNYDFQDKFSSVIIPLNTGNNVIRIYPDNDLTDFYLSWWPDWDYILSPQFKWSPDFNFPQKE